MGTGAIFISHMAEMLIPTMLIYAITFVGAKNTWKLRSGSLAVLGLFVVSFVVAGLINAMFHSQFSSSDYGMLAIFVVPLLVSLTAIYFLAPRLKE